MGLNLLSFVTLVLSEPCCVFYAIRHRIYWKFGNEIVFASVLIWYLDTHIHTKGTQGPIYFRTYKYILAPPVMCAQQLPVLHWMYNGLIQKVTLQSSTMSLLFKNYWLVHSISLPLIASPFCWGTALGPFEKGHITKNEYLVEGYLKSSSHM